MSYTVVVGRRQRKQLDALPIEIRSRIEAALLRLEDDPRPSGCIKLQGEENAWRIRVGDYRVVYEVHDQQLQIILIRSEHRSEVYR